MHFKKNKKKFLKYESMLWLKITLKTDPHGLLCRWLPVQKEMD